MLLPSSDATCSAPPSWSESDRLAALDRYAVLDTGREPVFDEVAELAADLLEAPIAVVNFIAADRQWFKAEVGINADTLPLDVSICRHAILQSEVLVVPDLRDDARFSNNPLVTAAEGLRFYAGALLETPEGLPLGTVCVLDTAPRPEGLSARQVRALRALAAQTMAHLELRRSAAAVRESEARFRNMADHAPVMMWVTDQSGVCTYLNRRWYEFTGQTQDAAEGYGWLEVTILTTRPARRKRSGRPTRSASLSGSNTGCGRRTDAIAGPSTPPLLVSGMAASTSVTSAPSSTSMSAARRRTGCA
jgi:PAS domain-containing protein